jgi:hypothetical protein
MLRLYPLGEIFDCDYCILVVSLSVVSDPTMSMPHLCNGHEGVMSLDRCDGALGFAENFWHALHVARTFDESSMTEGQ